MVRLFRCVVAVHHKPALRGGPGVHLGTARHFAGRSHVHPVPSTGALRRPGRSLRLQTHAGNRLLDLGSRLPPARAVSFLRRLLFRFPSRGHWRRHLQAGHRGNSGPDDHGGNGNARVRHLLHDGEHRWLRRPDCGWHRTRLGLEVGVRHVQPVDRYEFHLAFPVLQRAYFGGDVVPETHASPGHERHGGGSGYREALSHRACGFRLADRRHKRVDHLDHSTVEQRHLGGSQRPLRPLSPARCPPAHELAHDPHPGGKLAVCAFPARSLGFLDLLQPDLFHHAGVHPRLREHAGPAGDAAARGRGSGTPPARGQAGRARPERLPGQP